ncbi:hypothetical protein ACEQ6A_11395 [Rhizobium brockwellii]|uniref:hypothetical protein n=1 Tax=Rhizobium brockwellii TaxID=3019932 RepID=UPI003F956E4D
MTSPSEKTMPTRLALSECVEDLGKAKAIVNTVWLALSSSNFDKTDAADVLGTLFQACELLQSCYRISSEANSAEFRKEFK